MYEVFVLSAIAPKILECSIFQKSTLSYSLSDNFHFIGRLSDLLRWSYLLKFKFICTSWFFIWSRIQRNFTNFTRKIKSSVTFFVFYFCSLYIRFRCCCFWCCCWLVWSIFKVLCFTHDRAKRPVWFFLNILLHVIFALGFIYVLLNVLR